MSDVLIDGVYLSNTIEFYIKIAIARLRYCESFV